MTRRAGVTAFVLLVAIAPGTADAAFDSCVYDAGTRTVMATVAGGSTGRLYVDAAGAIVSDDDAGGAAQCGSGTTANTDLVDVRGPSTLAAKTAIVDNSGPGGAFRKPGTEDEIAIDVDLGETPWTYEPTDAHPSTLRLVGTPAHDEIRAGRVSQYGARAVNLDAQSDSDVDVQLTNVSILDLDGAGGNDHVTGLGGTGTVEQYPGALVLRGGPGDDELVGNGWANVLYPGPGTDDVDGGGNTHGCLACGIPAADVVSYEDSPNPVTIAYPRTYQNDDGSGSVDNYVDVEGIRGSDHADVLTNTGVPGFILQGAGGDDTITGGNQQDILEGGDGDDHLIADPGASFDTTGADQLRGGAGNDVLDGGQDPDVLNGGTGDDVLNAGAEVGDEYPYSKWNTLDGGPGSDTLNGGAGDDTYEFRPPDGDEVDTIHEVPGAGRDQIYAFWGDPGYGEPTTNHTIDLSSTTTALGTGGTRTFRVAQPGEAANLEDVTTGFGDDEVTGNAAVNDIFTGPGSDVVRTRDDVADTVDCGVDWGGVQPDTAIVDALDQVSNCETVDRSAPPPPPPPPARTFRSPALRFGGVRFTLRVPRTCVATPAGVRLRLARSASTSPSVSVRVVRATFFAAGRRLAVDEAAPFDAPLPADLGQGRHPVAVRLVLRRVWRREGGVAIGRPVTHALKTAVEICG